MQLIDDPDVTDAIRVYFVSVDPARDTPEILHDYVAYFNPDFVGATAPMDRLRVLTRSLGIAHEIYDQDGNYSVDHSAAIVLINPEAEFAALFGAPHDAPAMARDMARIVEYN
jgi:protein SCO1/2